MTMPKDHPCVRECPDRFPGCNCEKLAEYKRRKKEQKKLRKQADTVADYRKDAIWRNKKQNLRKKHRI